MKYYAAQRGNLVERYLVEVGRKLPEKLRADVQLELRSALQDALEERGLDAEKPQDEQKVAEVLKEFGKPSLVAESYGARNYLIGPELLPYYWLVLRISAIVIGTVQVIGLVLAATNQADLSAIFLGAFIAALNAVSGVAASMLRLAPFTALPLVDTIIKITIGIALVVTIIEAAGKLYRLLFPDRPSPWQTATAELKNLSRT